MRAEFSSWLQAHHDRDAKLAFLSSDLGFQTFEGLQQSMGPRFINTGIAEQNMISMAAGLARKGFHPICYSIAPFAIFRTYEQLRNDLGFHRMNVKVVGNGGGYGYGVMGPTHHALEDLAVATALPNFKCFIPFSDEDVEGACEAMMRYEGPSYLRLGMGKLPAQVSLPEFAPVRQVWTSMQTPAVTVATTGPIGLTAISAAIKNNLPASIFVFSEFPIAHLCEKFLASVKSSKGLLIVEEHIAQGGLGSHLALELIRQQVHSNVEHLFALGYPEERYGSQKFHQAQSGLDEGSIGEAILRLMRQTT